MKKNAKVGHPNSGQSRSIKVGQSRSIFFAKVGLAKVGLAKVGQKRMAKVGLAKVGISPKVLDLTPGRHAFFEVVRVLHLLPFGSLGRLLLVGKLSRPSFFRSTWCTGLLPASTSAHGSI